MPETRMTKVVGVTQKNDDGSSRQSLIRKLAGTDSSVILIYDYENEFSDHAVSVNIIDDDFEERQIGYLNDELAEEIFNKLENIRCGIVDVTGGEPGKPTLGVNLQLAIYSDEEINEWNIQKQNAAEINSKISNPKISNESVREIENKSSNATKNKPMDVTSSIQTPTKKFPRKTVSSKSRTIALVLCIFFGYFGAHQFYADRKTLGIVYIFTLGLVGFGWLIDTVLILTGNFKDKNKKLILNW